MKKARVLVIDDSVFVRKRLLQIIDGEHDMTVIGAAPDPIVAREMIDKLHPDVITLDVGMPHMDGLEFLEQLMRLHPTPVVMVSTLTGRGSEVTLRALELGAIDYVLKPGIGVADGFKGFAQEVTGKIRVAMRARPRCAGVSMQEISSRIPLLANSVVSSEKVIVIGASTGGTEAIKEVLTRLPLDSPGVLVTQHMPEAFTKSFAARLNELCGVSVKEAEHGERVLSGHVYIAPGHSHLLLKRIGPNYMTELSRGPPVNRHRPSVDVLFRSAAAAGGSNMIGIILTGMGKDGAAGMLEMKAAGAYNIAQDEASCVVFGMPREAIAMGGTDEVLSLHEIASGVRRRLTAMTGSVKNCT